MNVFIEIVFYTISAIILVLWLIPLILYLWGSMFVKGIMTSYFQSLNKYKNGKEKEK